MKLSWSHKVFLRINSHIGERPGLDRFMQFCADTLIYIVGSIALLWAIIFFKGIFLYVVIQSAGTLLLAFVISYFVALFWKHERPIKEFSHIRVLVHPLGTWKSFPSDHTIFATAVPLLVVVFGGPWGLVAILGFFGLGIALGRVYVGVHYPRDIIGGMIVGAGAVAIVASLFSL